ncbi:sulfatase-like hydrolase/transferase [Vallitalea guaymasensis]|uniref:sulfatase-like hydrolase/transferase n=1 Tax=Vallitalea guaymasensis TaxID=1185412 RepID=UPI00272C87EE|nr:sulfatase-like hydrolase/transferase [Vallitalea guaymasensis]
MTTTSKPNIIFILIDDMGYKDLSCYDSSFYETPFIDSLAHEGMLFTDGYASCPVCSPSRASIMSGKYPANIGVTDWIDHSKKCHPAHGILVDAPYIDHLPLEEISIAKALSNQGYQTWHVGKWHLGKESYYPEKHGFQVNIGGCYTVIPIMVISALMTYLHLRMVQKVSILQTD